MSNKYSTIHQHEPLRTPPDWGTPGKRFTAQLEELFDDLYSRLNRLRLNDLAVSLQTIITESADGVQSNRTAIEQTNEQITLLATQSSVDALSGRVTENEAQITILAGQIQSQVTRTEFDELGVVVSQHGTQITQTAEQISLKASKSDLDELTGRVNTAESSITQNANQIALKVSTTTYNNGMAGKADSSTVNALAQRVTTAESSITQNANAIALKVSAGDIASSINQTAQSVLISASKINLSGYVTISSLGAGGTTTIDGSRITTGTVAAARIDVDNLYVKHLNGADGTFTGSVTAGYWTFDRNGAVYYDPSTYRQVRMDVDGYIARYSTENMGAQYGSTSYSDCTIYGGAVTLNCASTWQSVSARNGYWGSYSYNDVCFVCDQAGSSYSTAAGNLGTTDNRWDILWVDTVHYNTRDTSSSREAKHDIEPLPDFGAVLDQLEPVSYKYIDDKNQRTRYGLIYEDTIGLMPDICHETTEGEHTFKGISYEDLITVLLKEVQSLRERVAKLEAADNT